MIPPEFGNTIDKLGGGRMTENHSTKNEANEAAKRNVVEKMWLNYYNNVLFEKGLITETQHRKMKLSISSRKPSALER